MPVLTYDITFGTKKVKYLNLSHNAITDLRKSKTITRYTLEKLIICFF